MAVSGSAARRGYSVSEAARLVGVSASTLRLWERHGLLRAARTTTGHRRYDQSELDTIRRVSDLRRVDGLPLARIRERLGEDPPSRSGDGRPPAADEPLGARLRAERVRQGLSLRHLAGSAGVSPSHLSGVERDAVQPSLATLQRITAALGTTVLGLTRARAPACALVRRGRAGRLEVRVQGVRIENLAPAAAMLEPQLFTLEPGAGSGGTYLHEGEEFLHVLAGTLDVWLDDVEHYRAGQGDSLCFPSTRRHRWRNPGPARATVIWVNTPPSF